MGVDAFTDLGSTQIAQSKVIQTKHANGFTRIRNGCSRITDP